MPDPTQTGIQTRSRTAAQARAAEAIREAIREEIASKEREMNEKQALHDNLYNERRIQLNSCLRHLNEAGRIESEAREEHRRANERVNQVVIDAALSLKPEQLNSVSGMEYTEAKRNYEDSINASSIDSTRLYEIYAESALNVLTMTDSVTPTNRESIDQLFVERDIKKQRLNSKTAEYEIILREYNVLRDPLKVLRSDISALTFSIIELQRRLTHEGGKRRHRTTYKKNKRFINSKKRKKLHTLRKKRRRTN